MKTVAGIPAAKDLLGSDKISRQMETLNQDFRRTILAFRRMGKVFVQAPPRAIRADRIVV